MRYANAASPSSFASRNDGFVDPTTTAIGFGFAGDTSTGLFAGGGVPAVSRWPKPGGVLPSPAMTTGEIEGFEALARWFHSELGEISPQRFVGLAKEIGLIESFGEKVMRRACLEFKTIHEASDRGELYLSVNLSCRQFANSGLVERISCILRDTEFAPVNLIARARLSLASKDEYASSLVKLIDNCRSNTFATSYVHPQC
jgi:hypothetical protein